MQEAKREEPVQGPSFEEEWITAIAAFTDDLKARGYSGFTLRDYRSDVLRIAGHLGLRPVELRPVHRETVERMLESLPMSPASRRRRLSAFGRFLTFMLHDRGEPHLGPQLLRAIVRMSPLDNLLVALVYLGGFRLMEIAHMEGRDIRIKKGVITSRLGYRLIPMHPRLREILMSMRGHTPLSPYRPLLPGVGGFRVNARTLHGRFQRVAARARMSGLKPDVLRRETSLFLIGLGTPPGLVKAFLGKDRGEPLAPRKGRLADLSCLRSRLERLPV